MPAEGSRSILFRLGVTETIIAVIFLIIQIVAVIIASASTLNAAIGFIGVIIMIVAGGLGISAGSNDSTINAHLGFSIAGSVISLANFIVGVVILPSIIVLLNGNVNSSVQGALALYIIVVILTLIEGVLFIVSSVFCCKTNKELGNTGCCSCC